MKAGALRPPCRRWRAIPPIRSDENHEIEDQVVEKGFPAAGPETECSVWDGIRALSLSFRRAIDFLSSSSCRSTSAFQLSRASFTSGWSSIRSFALEPTGPRDLTEKEELEVEKLEAAMYKNMDKLDAAKPNAEDSLLTYATRRAWVTRNVLEAVRPTGTTTGLRIDTVAGDVGPVSTLGQAAEAVNFDSQFLPAAWIRSVNGHRPVNLASLDPRSQIGREATALMASDGESLSDSFYRASTKEVRVSRDKPTILHELTHAVQHSDPDRRLTVASQSYYRVHAHRTGNSAWSPKWVMRDDDVQGSIPDYDKDIPEPFFDSYAGEDYARRDREGGAGGGGPRTYAADELTSTGIEYLVGGTRENVGSAAPLQSPYDTQYRTQLDFVMGQMLVGGPLETADDYRDAGLDPPEWALKIEREERK